MTKFILHGGFTREANDLNDSFFRELLNGVPDNSTILFVYFASRTEEEIPIKSEILIKKCTDATLAKNLKFKIATEEGFLKEIKGARVIFLSGGSTSKLLKTLRLYPDLTPFLEGKTIAGSSAGAYALAAVGASHSDESVREGLGIVPLRVICHFESEKLPPSQASVKVLINTMTNLELVTLKDFEWKAFSF
jgi:peptidase E